MLPGDARFAYLGSPRTFTSVASSRSLRTTRKAFICKEHPNPLAFAITDLAFACPIASWTLRHGAFLLVSGSEKRKAHPELHRNPKAMCLSVAM